MVEDRLQDRVPAGEVERLPGACTRSALPIRPSKTVVWLSLEAAWGGGELLVESGAGDAHSARVISSVLQASASSSSFAWAVSASCCQRSASG